MLYTKSKFLAEFHEARHTTNIEQGEWQIDTENNNVKVRQVNLKVENRTLFGPKYIPTQEIQTLRPCSRDNSLYAVDVTCSQTGAPLTDRFVVELHFCMKRVREDHTEFSMHAQLKYKKHVWGFIKSIIEQNVWAGMEEFYTSMFKALEWLALSGTYSNSVSVFMMLKSQFNQTLNFE